MKCPKCHCLESRVKKTLIQLEQMGGPPGFDFGELKRRERECLTCRAHFLTYEVHESIFAKIQEPSRPKVPSPTPATLSPRRPLQPPSSPAPDLRRSLDD